ncbi:methylenetetrahydrofolate--tRNA-(uracil(54)-C(5))-methyltransferase (FADH(2)-oxidizing) TrmFO [Myxococcus sp. CA056]|uniref:methylenetetrahydrofolate--tRNA-(uracil(54)- C(5))-methyltransferase (FADH(2)-oxidizing) TrmFO n=1 Tax=unclassified Myxococcus TaxID=2648731 RepID=UPI00157A8469|nr:MULTISPECIES: methylenetetrahydrofolate--tRNA-(uracil(54)-C(5))-methyltransferase (FADH(2)-oxidizing) TrmFO [unclassified Myxococcus]NTX14209.1 methylenetetrahydrofolate--tRNA-(uracil(54)-C(5))-methyltransferase (FADH(2)-oxidizing) TrmFO [Myxococcus sp. CA056]NTX35405.1 methylenetetrahydrofolate--tRNA-(uracil(54)-C(5))-methyltransferase (FADH(2)-oxidizing) TrmFO [Myxococcus sp. CA033]NTX56947.1 methylenetetrahydrofolate--tRNA-(uracil(54)-C(5))-methyltransferase (FADH(2)-oxidizing) TrmFO [Myxo
MADVKQQRVTVIGGGLAGTECAYQLARRGVPVVLREMKPHKRSPAHKSDQLAELVCSNSLRSDNPESAIGLLHAELRSLGSLILSSADAHRVPAGDALAVEREGFSKAITESLLRQAGVELVAGEVETLPEEGPVVVATGPLTSDALTRELERHVGQKLYFYDSIAPILSGDSIDLTVAFRQSRYGKGGGDDYLNLPMNREEYYRFIAELKAGQKVVPHSFEEPKYFEGCLPIEVMAERGDDTLAYGPMKPVGLRDPRTGQEPHAVVQLRMEDRAGTSWNMVGFQTRLTWGEQKRIFVSCIPGLQNAEFLRMGQIHRNTFIDSPRLLSADLSLKTEPRVFFAGQVSGVEGYVESAACGYLVALALHARLSGKEWVPPPATTALGSLFRHVTGEAHPPDYPHQPSNIIYGLFPPLTGRMKKADKRAAYSARAKQDLAAWLPHAGVPSSGTPELEEQRSA